MCVKESVMNPWRNPSWIRINSFLNKTQYETLRRSFTTPYKFLNATAHESIRKVSPDSHQFFEDILRESLSKSIPNPYQFLKDILAESLSKSFPNPYQFLKDILHESLSIPSNKSSRIQIMVVTKHITILVNSWRKSFTKQYGNPSQFRTDSFLNEMQHESFSKLSTDP